MEANESSRVSDDLTSTAESVLTNNGHEKKINHSDSISVGDSTPSSSSDANMQTSIVKTIHDDPISSTSDSLIHENEMNLNILTSDLNFIAGVETSGSTNDLGTDSDFFTSELSIASMATEKISEDVEDIANDLENLLGETTHSYGVICSNSIVVTNTSERLKEISTSTTNISGNLFGEHAEVDISGEVISQVEINLDKSHDEKEVLADKDVLFCNNSDILETNEKTESPVEYSSVDISNNDGELIPINTSTDTPDEKISEDVFQHAYSSNEVQNIEIEVSREDKSLHINQNDLNTADCIGDSSKKEGDEEKSSDKDLNKESTFVEENENSNLDLHIVNQKINEDKPNSTQTLVTNEADENVLVVVKTTSEALQQCEVDVFQETIAVDTKDASNEDKAVTSVNVENMDDHETTTALDNLENIEEKEEPQMIESNLNDHENVMVVGENIEKISADTLLKAEKNSEMQSTSNQAQIDDKSSETVVEDAGTVIFATAENIVTDKTATQLEFYEQPTEQQISIEMKEDNIEKDMENSNNACNQEKNISDLKCVDSNTEQTITVEKPTEAASTIQLSDNAEVMEIEKQAQSHDLKEEEETAIYQTHEEIKEDCELVIQPKENIVESKYKEDDVNPMEETLSNVSSDIGNLEKVASNSQSDDKHKCKDVDAMDGVILSDAIENLSENLETSDEIPKPNLDLQINSPVAPSESIPETIEHADVNMTIDSDQLTNKQDQERENELISMQTEVEVPVDIFDAESSDLSTNKEVAIPGNLANEASIHEDFATNVEQLEEITKIKSKDDVINVAALDISEEQRNEENIEFDTDHPILEDKSENVLLLELKENLESSKETTDNVTKEVLDEKNVEHQSEIIPTDNKCPKESPVSENTSETNKESSILDTQGQGTVQSANVDIPECVESISADKKLADTLIIKPEEIDIGSVEKNVQVIEDQEENNDKMLTNEIVGEIVDDKSLEVNDIQICQQSDTTKLDLQSSTENKEELISEVPEMASTSNKHDEYTLETIEKDDVSTKRKLDDNVIQEEIPDNDKKLQFSTDNASSADEILSKEFSETHETKSSKDELLCNVQVNEESKLNSESDEVGEIEKENLLPMELDIVPEAEVNNSDDTEELQSDDKHVTDHIEKVLEDNGLSVTQDLLNIKEATAENKNSSEQAVSMFDATEMVDHDATKQNVEADKKNDDLIMEESDETTTVNSVKEDVQEVDTLLAVKIIQDEMGTAPESMEELEDNEKSNKNIEGEIVSQLEPLTGLQESSESNAKLESCKESESKVEEDLEKTKVVNQKITDEVEEVSKDIAVLVQDNTEMLPDSSDENQSREYKSDTNIAEMQIEGADRNLQQTADSFLKQTSPLMAEDAQIITDDNAQLIEQETADSSTGQSLTFISEDSQVVENVASQSQENSVNLDQNNVQTSFEMFDKDEHQTKLESEDVIHLQEENYGLNIDESSDMQIEPAQAIDYCPVENVSDEPSELQCAISQIVDDMQPTDNSEASELQSAISHIIDSPEIMSDSNLTDHTPMAQIDSSEAMDDSQTFELQNAISQIVYSSDSTDDSKSAELQSAICQIIDNSEETEEDSELQNAITQIINTPELDTNSKIEQVLDMQVEQQSTEDNVDNKVVSIDQDNQLNDTELFETAKQAHEDAKTELKPVEKEIKFDGAEEKINSEVEMQSMYSQPVVDLMLEDMDDQLKHVIFESKSEDSIVNVPTITEVNLDTPKTFESQQIDLMLPEEASLLNTDDIISEIAPSSQNLDVQVIPEDGLKIAELHRSDSKDLNDVIAREIESLLELQTQGLSEENTAVDNVASDVADKIANEENQVIEDKISDVVSEGNSYQDAEGVDEKIQKEDQTYISVKQKSADLAIADKYQLHTEYKTPEDSAIKEVVQSGSDSKHVSVLPGKVDIGKKEKIRQKEDTDYKYDDLKSNTRQKSVAEVSSTTVVKIAESINQEVDCQITSTAVEHPRNEPVKPLLIEVGTPIEMESNSQLQANVEISTSNYSSKMSENEDLKMTITKHKIESTSKAEVPVTNEIHSILKIYDPKDTMDSKKSQKKEGTVPKLIIKPIVKSQQSPTPSAKIDEAERETVPKLFIRNMSPNRPGSPKVVKSQKSEITSPLKLTIKPVLKPEECQSKSSPKLTIKPIVKTEEESSTSGPKITIKPIIKPPEEELCHSPKITIKPIIKPDDCQSEMVHSPRITIKPIPKPDDVKEYTTSDVQSSRITIKPILKPEACNSPEQEVLKRTSDVDGADRSHSPRITIKPILKPDEHKSNIKQDQKLKQEEFSKLDKKEGSPKITIKPVVKPVENEAEPIELIDFEEQIKQERIVLKINKNSMGKDSRKRDSTEEIEKLAKIKLKFSKEGGHAHIVSEQSKLKRALEESIDCDQKRTKFESDDLTITPIDADAKKTEKVVDIIKDDVNITPINPTGRPMFEDPLEKIPVFEITPESAVIMKSSIPTTVQQVTTPTPRKRGRPRKVPLVVREEFKDVKEEEILQQQEQPAPEDTGRPKRSCRGPSVRTTLGIRTRKPRGSGRGRGRGRVARGVGSRGGRQQRVSAAKLKLLKEEAAAAIAEQSHSLEPEDGGDIEMKEELPVVEDVSSETAEIVLIEEETRMSADINISRAQTPAKQGDNSLPTSGDVEDTQSSVQSTATTESTKGRKGTRTEVHQEPEGEVISADQLTEYYWGGGGPYMLQEQVAQFLGIKSFKRKYPGIQRRTVDMQERDFIRESGLVSEAMCDLGLTAVHSADILDILYSDFQHKYEEYCKHQRDRQAKDFSNKQKALSLAASQEKNKHDIVQQAVQSAASWNTNFNKSRREERKACMDLQTFTIHYPKGRFKNVDRNKTGHYPVALVPGQYTDYYKGFTPTELSNLPLNTMLNKPINLPTEDDSPSDGSGSDSDSSSSDSDSSSSSSSGEDCNICSPSSSNQTKKVLAN